MLRAFALSVLVLGLIGGPALATGLLDGRVFSGQIGPAENPDLDDSLHFNDGFFWSDICTRCGFVPGEYTAETTADGISFTGRLESDSRGQFDYVGLVRPDGSIDVTITWQRKRWYWTSERQIVFQGSLTEGTLPLTLAAVRQDMASNDPNTHPLCARF